MGRSSGGNRGAAYDAYVGCGCTAEAYRRASRKVCARNGHSRAANGGAGGRRGRSNRRRCCAAAALDFERGHLHDPISAGGERGRGRVRTGGGADLIFGEIRVMSSDDAGGESRTRSRSSRGDGVGAKDKVVGSGGSGRATVRGSAAADSSSCNIKRVGGIGARVLQNANVRIDCGLGEVDRDGVAAALDVLGVIDGLPRAGSGGGTYREGIRVPQCVGDRTDRGGRVVPADHDNVQVAGDLRLRVGNWNGRGIGLRRGGRHLHKGNAAHRRRVQPVHHQRVREGGHVYLSIGNGQRRELGVISEAIAGRVLVAVPQFVAEVGGIEGAHDACHRLFAGISQGSGGPHDSRTALVAIRGKR